RTRWRRSSKSGAELGCPPEYPARQVDRPRPLQRVDRGGPPVSGEQPRIVMSSSCTIGPSPLRRGARPIDARSVHEVTPPTSPPVSPPPPPPPRRGGVCRPGR